MRLESGAIAEIVETRLFSTNAEWHSRGRFEKLLWRWLTPREKVLAEFAFPFGIRILLPWTKIFRNLGITFLIAIAGGFRNPELQIMLLSIGLFVTICQVVAQIHAAGAAFRSMRNSGVNVPLYAGYAVGFNELSRLLLKYTAVQLPFLVFFSTLSGAVLAYLIKWPIGMGLILGIKASGILAALRFIFVILAFSSGTNDSSRFSLRNIIVILSVACCGLCFLGLGMAGLFMLNEPVAWLFWALAIVNAYVLFVLYRWFYNHGWFDLMNMPRQ